jgi:hypothetical protein
MANRVRRANKVSAGTGLLLKKVYTHSYFFIKATASQLLAVVSGGLDLKDVG